MEDYYQDLGVSRTAKPEEIREAYRRGVMSHHPDRNPQARDSTEFRKIQEAYDVLGDPDRRSRYDRRFPDERDIPSGPVRVNDPWGDSPVRPKYARSWPEQEEGGDRFGRPAPLRPTPFAQSEGDASSFADASGEYPAFVHAEMMLGRLRRIEAALRRTLFSSYRPWF